MDAGVMLIRDRLEEFIGELIWEGP